VNVAHRRTETVTRISGLLLIGFAGLLAAGFAALARGGKQSGRPQEAGERAGATAGEGGEESGLKRPRVSFPIIISARTGLGNVGTIGKHASQ